MKSKLFLILLLLCVDIHALDLSLEIKKLPQGTTKILNIDIGEGQTLAVTLDKTSKGNGTILLDEYALLRIFDVHNDGFTYKNEALNVVFRDIDFDNVDEIIVTGIIEKYDEKENLEGMESSVTIYKLVNAKYEIIFMKSPINIEIARL